MRSIDNGKRALGVGHGRRIVVTGGVGFLGGVASGNCGNAPRAPDTIDSAGRAQLECRALALLRLL